MDKISKLPEPYKALAELRRKQSGWMGVGREDGGSDSLLEFFPWPDTPEGFDFWDKVYKADTDAGLPTIPNKSLHGVVDSLETRVRAVLRGLRDTSHALVGQGAKHQDGGDTE